MKLKLDQTCRQIVTARLVLAGTVLTVGILAAAIADAQGAGGGQRPRGAPPEALKACAGKSVGDSCEMQMRGQGSSVPGECIATPDDQIACMPEGAPPPPKS